MPKEIKLILPKPHSGRRMGGQERIIREAKRYNVLDCGRRFGKTDLCQTIISQPLLDGYPVGWFAPTYKILDDAWSEIKRVYAPIITRSNNTDKVIEFVTGGVLEAWTLDKEGAGRSRKYKRIVIDEAARVKGLWDIFNYDLRATLLDYNGDAWFPSTPKGLNDYYKMWTQADISNDWARWKMPTSENPYIEESEIEAMRSSMPERVAKQELDAEFLEDGSFFQNVEACCVIEAPANPQDHENHRFCAGLDWALSDDFSVLTVVCATCGAVVDWWSGNKMDYSMQIEFIIGVLNKWKGVTLLPERNSIGVPNIENLARKGVQMGVGPDGSMGFYTTSITKSELIMKLALVMQKNEMKLPREYADELRSYEVEITTRNPKFGAPAGHHDDRVISSALAVWLSSKPMQIFI